MKAVLCLWLIMTYCKTVGYAVANQKTDSPNENNVFIITLDGFRWQELFFGADSSLIHNQKFTKEQDIVKTFFWDEDFKERRKKLLPFFWNVIAKDGQLFGNRAYNNRVNVSNVYALSYPGYNEIFTGNTDFSIFSNSKIKNRNISFFEYLDEKSSFKGKVASFTSWGLFPFIFNKDRSTFYLNSQNRIFEGNSSSFFKKDNDNNSIRNDFETYSAAKEYILSHHPRVVHIGLSGTDTYGHKKQYDYYLYQAHLADKLIAGLWRFVQACPFYRDNTTFIITTDHGRGSSDNSWYNHGMLVSGSSQTWAALIGNGIRSVGESRQAMQLYQKQVAGTMGYFLNATSYKSYSFPLTYFTTLNKKKRRTY